MISLLVEYYDKRLCFMNTLCGAHYIFIHPGSNDSTTLTTIYKNDEFII